MMNSSYDPMEFAKLRAQQKTQAGQTGAALVKGFGDIAAQLVKTRTMMSDGQVKVNQAHQAAVNAVKTKLESLVGAEKAQKIADQSITIPRKEHWKDPASYIDQLTLDAKGIEGLVTNLQTKRQGKVSEGITAGMRPDTEQVAVNAPNQYIQDKSGMGLRTPQSGTANVYGAVPGTAPGTKEAIATRTTDAWQSDQPKPTMDEFKADPRFATAPEAITPAQRLAYDAGVEKANLTAEQKAAAATAKAQKEAMDRMDKADAKKRAEVQNNLTRSRKDLATAQEGFTSAEASYTELQAALDAVDKGESVAGEFYRDEKSGVRYKSADEMRMELTRREDALDLAKKSRNKAKSAIEKWQEEDTMLSRRIEQEIEVEQQAAQEKQAKLKAIRDAVNVVPSDSVAAVDSDPKGTAYHVEKLMRDAGVDSVIIKRIIGQLEKGTKLSDILDTINSHLSE